MDMPTPGREVPVDDVYLRPGDSFELLGKVYVVQSRCSEPLGYVVVDPTAPSVEHAMPSRNIKSWHAAGKLRFMSRDEFGLALGVRENLRRSLRSFGKDERREMLRRLRYCMAVDDLGPGFGRSEATLQPVCDRVALQRGDTGPHDWATVYRWWTTWIRSGRDPRALCPSTRKRGNRTRRLEEYQLRAMREAIQQEYLRRHRPSMATAYKACIGNITRALGGPAKTREAIERMANDPDRNKRSPFPSLKAFRAECKRMSKVVRVLNREGPDAARQRFYPVGAGPDVRFPFERVEADFKYLRLFVVDDATGLPLGTPSMMAAIDCYSGCIAGWDVSFDPPSYVSAARTLKHLIGFKDLSWVPNDEDGLPIVRNPYPINGVPFQFFLDNDQAFHSKHMFRTAQALGCHVDYIPPSQHWKKGRIERFWLTVQQCFLDMFPGKVLRIGEKPGKDYKPEDDAVVTLSQLRLLITKAIVDVYHQEIDEQTGKRRIDLWSEAVAVNQPRPVRAHDDLVELVGAVEIRTAERRGLRLFGLRYNGERLALYRAGFEKDQQVEVRYDAQDIGKVTVVDRERDETFDVPCTRPDYARGLTLHQHLVIQRRAKDRSPEGRIQMGALLIAKGELFEIGRKMIGALRSRRGRMRVAQFLGVDRRYFDLLSRRPEDAERSREHLDLDAPDDPVDTGEDDGSSETDGGARRRGARRLSRTPAGAAPLPRETPREPPADEPTPPSSRQASPLATPPAVALAPTDTSPEGVRHRTHNMKVSFDD